MRVLNFVIPGQVVRLFLIAKSLTLEVFEESFEGVKLRSIHGRLLFHSIITYPLLTINFLLVVTDPGLDHQGVDGRFLGVGGEVIFNAPAVRVLTGSGLLDLGQGIFGHLCQRSGVGVQVRVIFIHRWSFGWGMIVNVSSLSRPVSS